uniref:Uncharacterized protein n=1 Tax=Apteryx owenii TaxID=8824 RepID=A0A8B9SCW8_APTOW
MAKRKVTFEDPEDEEEPGPPRKREPGVPGGPGSRFPGKHSLDSDEEDEAEGSSKYDVLAPHDVEGERGGGGALWGSRGLCGMPWGSRGAPWGST